MNYSLCLSKNTWLLGVLCACSVLVQAARATDSPPPNDTGRSSQSAMVESTATPVRAFVGYAATGPSPIQEVSLPNPTRSLHHADDSPPYGNNPKVGHYLQVDDAKLYYEIYGKGSPILLLHGSVYGYIDELGPFIDQLAQTHQVICLATRGHGKSEVGHTPFSYQQRAQDAYQLIRAITADSVTVLGFSDGAFAGYKLAAVYPQAVKRLVAIGAGDRPTDVNRAKRIYSPAGLLSGSKAFFEGRLALMPEPKRWAECLSMLNQLYNQDFLSRETFGQIRCPVLVMGGDQDAYESVEQLIKAARAIPKSQLSIIPGCGHVVFHCNFPAVWSAVRPFLP